MEINPSVGFNLHGFEFIDAMYHVKLYICNVDDNANLKLLCQQA